MFERQRERESTVMHEGMTWGLHSHTQAHIYTEHACTWLSWSLVHVHPWHASYMHICHRCTSQHLVTPTPPFFCPPYVYPFCSNTHTHICCLHCSFQFQRPNKVNCIVQQRRQQFYVASKLPIHQMWREWMEATADSPGDVFSYLIFHCSHSCHLLWLILSVKHDTSMHKNTTFIIFIFWPKATEHKTSYI